MPRSSRPSTLTLFEPDDDRTARSAIASVRLSRGMCYGTCPVYEVVLRRDGTASWRGKAFTDRLGEFEGKVDEPNFVRLGIR